ncbi:unnamed protein product [Mytilus coruscus]|uniref:CxC2-like cysteine cluster KDZ transposase-associated domain-containing protein n=1 Tax=Mytilus coruscus TaxID=42192 RepID=A0A6J8AJ39_MYTCO|nr:unnamed protein product [Mytilus coruscus]
MAHTEGGQQSLFVPMPMINELHRKDHACETAYNSTSYAVDVKGTQHTCRVTLCRCEDPATTLLRYNLWPATPTSPKIAFDLRGLDTHEVLGLLRQEENRTKVMGLFSGQVRPMTVIGLRNLLNFKYSEGNSRLDSQKADNDVEAGDSSSASNRSVAPDLP